MNVGIVTTWADCGAGYVSRAYADVLRPWCSVFIYARGSYMRPSKLWREELGYPVEEDGCEFGVTRVRRAQFARWIRRNQIDVVLFNEQRFWTAVVWARSLGVRCVAYVDYYTSQTLPLFRLYDGVVCNTRRHCVAMSGHPRVCYLPWGTDCSLYRPAPHRQDGLIRFLHSAGAGGPNDRKGTGVTIAAFNATPGKASLHIDSQIALSDVPREWRAGVLADRRIEWIHRTTQPPHSYHEADVYVYPSRLEGIGLTVVESLASGVPVISTDVPPINEFVDHRTSGLLVPPVEYRGRFDGYLWPEAIPSVEGVSKAMRTYIDSPQLAKQHSYAARKSAETRLDWKINSGPFRGWLECLDPAPIEMSDLDGLAALAHRLDSIHDPSPVDLLVRAAKESARIVRKRLYPMRKVG